MEKLNCIFLKCSDCIQGKCHWGGDSCKFQPEGDAVPEVARLRAERDIMAADLTKMSDRLTDAIAERDRLAEIVKGLVAQLDPAAASILSDLPIIDEARAALREIGGE